jgi:hypothetical protein
LGWFGRWREIALLWTCTKVSSMEAWHKWCIGLGAGTLRASCTHGHATQASISDKIPWEAQGALLW